MMRFSTPIPPPPPTQCFMRLRRCKLPNFEVVGDEVWFVSACASIFQLLMTWSRGLCPRL